MAAEKKDGKTIPGLLQRLGVNTELMIPDCFGTKRQTLDSLKGQGPTVGSSRFSWFNKADLLISDCFGTKKQTFDSLPTTTVDDDRNSPNPFK